jgi:hypothetical protein
VVIARVRSTLRLFSCLLATAIVAVSLLPAPLAAAAAKAPAPASREQGGAAAGATEQRRTAEREASRRRTAANGEPGSLTALPVIFVAAALLLGAIAAYIVRDARRHAPVIAGVVDGASKAIRAAQARKRRAKAKAARQQRKRNR